MPLTHRTAPPKPIPSPPPPRRHPTANTHHPTPPHGPNPSHPTMRFSAADSSPPRPLPPPSPPPSLPQLSPHPPAPYPPPVPPLPPLQPPAFLMSVTRATTHGHPGVLSWDRIGVGVVVLAASIATWGLPHSCSALRRLAYVATGRPATRLRTSPATSPCSTAPGSQIPGSGPKVILKVLRMQRRRLGSRTLRVLMRCPGTIALLVALGVLGAAALVLARCSFEVDIEPSQFRVVSGRYTDRADTLSLLANGVSGGANETPMRH